MLKKLVYLSSIAILSTNAIAFPKEDSAVMKRLNSNYEAGISIANQNQFYEFNTPGANSILTYDKMSNPQVFLDAKYKFFTGRGLDHAFIFAEGSFGQTNKGEVRDDDIRNSYGAMSYHKLSANNNHKHIGVGLALDLSNYSDSFKNHILSFDIGYFDRFISTRSAPGASYYAYVPSNFAGGIYQTSDDQISRATFRGLSLGTKIEKIIDEDSSISLKFNALYLQYKSQNYWRNRDMNWSMDSGKNQGATGFSIKPEYTTNLTNHVDLNIFGYYEVIKVKNLIEHQAGYTDASGNGSYATVKTSGLGLGLKFW